MRTTFQRVLQPMRMTRRHALVAAVVVAATLAPLTAASPALATSTAIKEEFLPFDNCPVQTAEVCTVAYTTGGEFVIDHKTVPIHKTITLQGGLASSSYEAQPLIAAVGVPSLSLTPLTVPGGLAGIEGLEGIGGEVTATAELVGPPSSIIVNKQALATFSGAAVTLPIKVKLSNEVLGDECYVGSDAEPIVLHLTTGFTSPPSPTAPIRGSHTSLEGKDKGRIKYIEKVSLVDNDFAVPGASGCGGSLSPLIDLVLDADIGIPAQAGQSTAIMDGSLEEAASEWVAKYKPKQKKAKK
jgi:hypothetical protein